MGKKNRYTGYENEIVETSPEFVETEATIEEKYEEEVADVLEYGPEEVEEETQEVAPEIAEVKKEMLNVPALMSKVLSTYSATISKIVGRYQYYEIVSIDPISERLSEVKFKVNSSVTFSVVFEPIHNGFSLQKIKVL